MEEVVEGIEDLTDHREKVCLGDALDEFGSRSFGPLLVLLPLIELSPVGGIPGVPTVLALLIASIAVQILFGKEHVWVPGFIEKRALSADRLNKWAHRLEGTAARIDHWFKVLAPSPELRKWYGHVPERWPEFRSRYEAELASADEDEMQRLLDTCRAGPVSFVFAARDEARNSAVVLRDHVMKKLL